MTTGAHLTGAHRAIAGGVVTAAPSRPGRAPDGKGSRDHGQARLGTADGGRGGLLPGNRNA